MIKLSPGQVWRSYNSDDFWDMRIISIKGSSGTFDYQLIPKIKIVGTNWPSEVKTADLDYAPNVYGGYDLQSFPLPTPLDGFNERPPYTPPEYYDHCKFPDIRLDEYNKKMETIRNAVQTAKNIVSNRSYDPAAIEDVLRHLDEVLEEVKK